MSHASISVIIPAYNCEGYISQAVQSVLDQTYPVSEIIVIDDGSTDQTVDRLNAFRARIRLLRQENAGVAAARNAGMRAAQGEFIAFLDADDWWAPSRLSLQMAALERFPEAGLVFSDFTVVDSNGIAQMPSGIRWKYRAVTDPVASSWAVIFSESTQVHGSAQGASAYLGRILEHLFQGNFINTSTVLLRRSAAVQAGCFDLSLDTEEDYDYWLKVSADWPLVYVDATLAAFRRNPDQLTRAEQIGRIVSNALRVVKNTITRNPGRIDQRIVRERLAHLHATLGVIELRNNNNRREARTQLMRSMQLRPRRMLPWILYLATLLPSEVLHRVENMMKRKRRARVSPGQ